MTRFDVILGKNIIPTKKRTLRLILDEDEEIIQCIKQGLQENNIKKASVKSIKGIVKNCNISIIEEGRKELENIEILNTNGIFSIGGDDLWGQLNVFVGTKKPLVGKLVKGIASQNLEIILEY